MHLSPVETRLAKRSRVAVAVRQDNAAGLTSYLMVAGIAAGLIVLWAGICAI